MNDLKTKYDYGVVLEDNDIDRKIANTLDLINDNLDDGYGAFLDLTDGDADGINAYVELKSKMAYYDMDILNDIKKVCADLGLKCVIDDIPDVDMDWSITVTYNVYVAL